jgi:hypothetical protein
MGWLPQTVKRRTPPPPPGCLPQDLVFRMVAGIDLYQNLSFEELKSQDLEKKELATELDAHDRRPLLKNEQTGRITCFQA